jgi:hypothetical protein
MSVGVSLLPAHHPSSSRRFATRSARMRRIFRCLHPATPFGVAKLDMQIAVLFGFDQRYPAGQFIPFRFPANARGPGSDFLLGRLPIGNVGRVDPVILGDVGGRTVALGLDLPAPIAVVAVALHRGD